MILTEIKYLIGVHLGEKGLPPAIIAPVLNVLTLIDEEIVTVGLDFSNPEIAIELMRLRQAIVKWNYAEDEPLVPIEEAMSLTPFALPKLFEKKLEKEDELSWLDEEEDELES